MIEPPNDNTFPMNKYVAIIYVERESYYYQYLQR